MCINVRNNVSNRTVYASFKHTFSIPSLLNFSFLVLLEYFGTFCFFCLPVLPSYWRRDIIKKRYTKRSTKSWFLFGRFVTGHFGCPLVPAQEWTNLVIQTGNWQPVFIWREKPVLLAFSSNLTISVPASYPVFCMKWREISWVIFCGTNF